MANVLSWDRHWVKGSRRQHDGFARHASARPGFAKSKKQTRQETMLLISLVVTTRGQSEKQTACGRHRCEADTFSAGIDIPR
jgi:hypothetical protein